MRIKSLEIKGFRAFSGDHKFDLDGDIVLVVGVNGQGKTSFFDAILWALTGDISRLGRPDAVVSLYSKSGEAQVRVAIQSTDGRVIEVTRHSDGNSNRLFVEAGGSSYSGEEAELELIRRIWPEGMATNDPRAALRVALERGIYLQQDVLTDFLTADSDNERFNAVSEIMGVGLITNLQASLESSRRAWSRATNQMRPRMQEAEERLLELETQIKEISDAGHTVSVSLDDWTSWWTQISQLGISNIDPPSIDSSDSHAAIDVAMAELRANRVTRMRRGERLRELREAIGELPPTSSDLDELRQIVEESTRSLEISREILSEAEARVTEIRRRQIEARSEQEELRVLAEVALRHLGEHCPICDQAYDKELTQQRLTSVILNASTDLDSIASTPDLALLAADVQAKERDVAAAGAALHNAIGEERTRAEILDRIRVGFSELEIDVPDEDEGVGVIEAELRENTRDLEVIASLGIQGEHIALSLARSGQLARRAELERQLFQASKELEARRRELQERDDTGEMITSMITGLREASSDLVEGELRRLDGLLQRIYSTADPHPEFRVVRFLSNMRYGHGNLLAEIEDSGSDIRKDEPRAYLSSSQLNVLAVSVFLALNLGISRLPLQMTILDDPLQSLDDINLLGLVDLLRRTRERRQLMMSTHDVRFASMLERKLRPVSDSQRTIHIELRGWSGEGPVVSQYNVMRDTTPIRLAAA